ncbi:MAG: nucleotidyl transferase AbiEii/AbiGii toxin family protein [Tissierellia bacterium]|nr:nucleotidyl transferase AbiEii/AbiGii toxin family protein [Proteiniphilum sp.]MDD4439977.1 nucleotidyl transferase AbiEii/AbiGii toxin family protein [Tissierellia bacterium]
MVSINKHKFFLIQILKDIYSDIELANCLGFKGGTALMFFYDLPRFSVDLDFNLLDPAKEKAVYEKVRKILSKHGKILLKLVWKCHWLTTYRNVSGISKA